MRILQTGTMRILQTGNQRTFRVISAIAVFALAVFGQQGLLLPAARRK